MVELIDITTPGAREHSQVTEGNELLVVAVPVYMGRVPAIITGWLNSIKADSTPAVCVVVYGNRVYEDALLELKDILQKCGCLPVAGAAFIGEHSFSSPETPIAEARPDRMDISHAEAFGRKIREKMQSLPSLDQISGLLVPGCHPYRGSSTLWSVDFIATDDHCRQCGLCAENCPAGAIDRDHTNNIDIEKCITCCACIKNCPQNSRKMKDGPVREASLRLNKLYRERKEPEIFL